MGTPGATELLIVLVIVLLILGPKRLPGLGRQLGGGMREFKDAITGSGRERDDEEVARPRVSEAGDDGAATPPVTAARDDSAPPEGRVVDERPAG